MLTIRTEQMAALQMGTERVFLSRLGAHVARRWDVRVTAEAREVWIEDAVRRARGYRLKNEADITEFVDLTFELGREFDLDPRHAAASAILKGRAMAAVRMRQLRGWASSVRASTAEEA